MPVFWWVAAALLGAAALVFALVGERGGGLRRSTVRMARLNGWRRLLNGETLHGYVYARWPNQYVALGRALEPYLFRFRFIKRYLADTYHGKVMPTPLARRLVSVRQPIALHSMEQVVPYPLARDIILQAPVDVAAIECPCRASVPDPCLPTQVCLAVGKPFVDFTLEHHPETSRRLTTAEALALLEGEARRGHVHTAYFKESAAGRFYAICNCCKCCCGTFQMYYKGAAPLHNYASDLAVVDPGACTACGICAERCPMEAIDLADDVAAIDAERCIGCGVCAAQCSMDAIRLESTGPRYARHTRACRWTYTPWRAPAGKRKTKTKRDRINRSFRISDLGQAQACGNDSCSPGAEEEGRGRETGFTGFTGFLVSLHAQACGHNSCSPGVEGEGRGRETGLTGLTGFLIWPGPGLWALPLERWLGGAEHRCTPTRVGTTRTRSTRTCWATGPAPRRW